MGWLDNLMGSGGYEDAQDALSKYHQQAMGYMHPYWQTGIDAGKGLTDAAGQLMDPQALESKWISGYQESPYAKQEQEAAQQQGMSAASSMGLEGSSPALQAIQQGTSNIGMADRQQYLKDLMDKYTMGINVNRGLYGAGATMAGQMGQDTEHYGDTMANLQYGADEAPWGTLGKIGGGILGWMAGGPAGAAAGAKIGGNL